jgi:predicted permease
MDLKYALRSLLRQPLFTAGAVLTLALGVGVNSTIFTFMNAALFRPVAGVHEPDRLVWVSSVWRDRGREVGASYPDFVDFREGTRDTFIDLVAFRRSPLSLGSGGDPARISGHFVTGSYFSMLGVPAASGRTLTAGDDRPGAEPVAVISHRLWEQRFATASEVVGGTLVINGQTVPVVGVAAPGFSGPAIGEPADVWLPLNALPAVRTADRSLLADRGSSWLLVMGRLQPEATMAQAQAALSTIAAGLERAHPRTNGNRSVVVSSGQSGLPPAGRSELVPLGAMLLIVTAIVLLIACANIANLLLARGAGRALEMSIRAAVGASRGRLVRQLLTESSVLALLGAGAGLLLSFWVSDLLMARLPEAEFRGLRAAPDLRVILFTAAAASLSVIAFGLLPALTTSRGALVPRLRETAGTGGRTRLQGAFVVAQLSLSLVLLLAGGLSLRAMQKAQAIDLGFEPSGVLLASYDLPLQNYTPERRVAFRRQLRAELEALPGVLQVGIGNTPPLGGTMIGTVIESTGQDGAPAQSSAYLNGVDRGFFQTLHLPLIKGRGFTDADLPGAMRTAVVNETLAARLWGDADPLGRRIDLGGRLVEVVGVARDSKYDEATEDPRPFLYLSLDQDPQLDRETVLVRTASRPELLAVAVQARIRALDPALPVFDVETMEARLRQRTDKQRGVSALLAAFGLVALLLAALGLYGVMAYAVTRRTREMGIRLALGASPAELMTLITRDGLRLALIGIAIGTAIGLPLAAPLGTLVFGVGVADVLTFALACLVLLAIALLASALPASRASRLDPIAALRAE